MSFVPAHCLHPLHDYPCVSLHIFGKGCVCLFPEATKNIKMIAVELLWVFSSCVDGYLCLFDCACVSASLCGAANLFRGNRAYSMQHLLFPPQVQGDIFCLEISRINSRARTCHVLASALTCARKLSIFIANIKFLERFVDKFRLCVSLCCLPLASTPLFSCRALFLCCQNTCFRICMLHVSVLLSSDTET